MKNLAIEKTQFQLANATKIAVRLIWMLYKT